jgi:hypothetical protein
VQNRTIIVVHESITESLVKDAYTCVALVASVGVGVYVDSQALQWIGGLLFMLTVAMSATKQRYTIDGARKRLDELEAELQQKGNYQ